MPHLTRSGNWQEVPSICKSNRLESHAGAAQFVLFVASFVIGLDFDPPQIKAFPNDAHLENASLVD
jgi:hypothetical protein